MLTLLRRDFAVALVVGGKEGGAGTFRVDTGNSQVTIADDSLAASLAAASGGRWSSRGLVVRATPAAAPSLTFVLGGAQPHHIDIRDGFSCGLGRLAFP